MKSKKSLVDDLILDLLFSIFLGGFMGIIVYFGMPLVFMATE